MSYLGNPLSTAFSSRIKQDFASPSGTSFTMNQAVSDPNDISLYINHVRQEPGIAYTVDGSSTLTTTGTLTASDDMYIIYDELTIQTAEHPEGQALRCTSIDATDALSVSHGKIANSVASFINTSYNSNSNGVVHVKQSAGTNSPTMLIEQTGAGGNPDDTQGLEIKIAGQNQGSGRAISVVTQNPNLYSGNAVDAFVVTNGGNVDLYGNLAFTRAGYGINFSSSTDATGTPAPTNNSELLDEFEEGTFTAKMVSSGATFAYGGTGGDEVPGHYVKIGKLVHISISTDSSTNPTGTLTNAVTITNLPFSSAVGSPLAHYYHRGPGDDMDIMSNVYQTTINLYATPPTGVWGNLTANHLDHTDMRFNLAGTYKADA